MKKFFMSFPEESKGAGGFAHHKLLESATMKLRNFCGNYVTIPDIMAPKH